jgi:hypothetical protein
MTPSQSQVEAWKLKMEVLLKQAQEWNGNVRVRHDGLNRLTYMGLDVVVTPPMYTAEVNIPGREPVEKK